MPGIGILGATFGYVVAMDSPSSRPATQFQWGTTLWHEMAHVFTLEATGHLVPRWFSEGVSVFEEWTSGPNPGVRIPIPVLVAMKDDRFLPIADLDEGFLRPTYEEQVIVSYMQAGLVCRFIEQRFGAGKLAAMLAEFADGLGTSEAVQAALGVTTNRFDEEFDAYLESRFGALLDDLDAWHGAQTRMLDAADQGDWDTAIETAREMLELMPGYVEPDSPYLVLAHAQEEAGDRDAALATLETFWRQGGFEPDALKRLAGWLAEDGRRDDAIEVLRGVILVQPLDLELHGTLGDLLLDAGDVDAAIMEYRVALAMEPHDKATAHYRLARAHRAGGELEESRRELLLALDVAPHFRPAQRLLLELVRSEQDSDKQ